MFRKSHNRAVIHVRIETVTPLLICAGDSGLDPVAADLTCVRTHHGRHGRTVYIPGSSLKGVIRAAAESSVRGRPFGHHLPQGACEDPLDHKDKNKSCGARWMNSKDPSHAVHKGHCLACRLFGSLGIRGRASVRDLFPWSSSASDAPGDNFQQANRLELRHGVSIDRISGSVKHGPFDQELVPSGVSFWGDIALENYQVWQLGLLAEAFTQINDGIAQLGMSKSRGLGVARVHVERIVHEQAGTHTQPLGAGDLATPQERDLYGLTAESALPATQGTRRGLAMRFEVTENTGAWLNAGLQALGDLQ